MGQLSHKSTSKESLDEIQATMKETFKFIPAERRVRTHRKSRNGCSICKSKRIKCSEAHPQCHSCHKNNAECIYPNNTNPSRIHGSALQTNHLGLSLRELRWFHDFMTVSRPHLPLKCETIWLRDVPVLAQEYKFLMHGILALGAAHLHARTDLVCRSSVDWHRALALQGLNSRNSGGSCGLKGDSLLEDSEKHATALLATCYLLTFTSSYLGDSLDRLLVLVRGCSSLTSEMEQAGLSSPFIPLNTGSDSTEPNTHLDVMTERLKGVAPLPKDDVEDALVSLERVEIECSLLPFHKTILDCLKAALDHVDEPAEAYRNYIAVWNLFASMPPEDFASFTDNTNATSVILQAHFLAIEALFKPWLAKELDGRFGCGQSLLGFRSSATLSGHSNALLKWPMVFLQGERMDVSTNGVEM